MKNKITKEELRLLAKKNMGLNLPKTCSKKEMYEKIGEKLVEENTLRIVEKTQETKDFLSHNENKTPIKNSTTGKYDEVVKQVAGMKMPKPPVHKTATTKEPIEIIPPPIRQEKDSILPWKNNRVILNRLIKNFEKLLFVVEAQQRQIKKLEEDNERK